MIFSSPSVIRLACSRMRAWKTVRGWGSSLSECLEQVMSTVSVALFAPSIVQLTQDIPAPGCFVFKEQIGSAIHHYLVYAHLIICICEVIELLNYCYQIYKNLPMVCTLNDLRKDVKWSTLKWNHKPRARESVWFSVISIVDKSIDHRKLLSICFVFYLQ